MLSDSAEDSEEVIEKAGKGARALSQEDYDDFLAGDLILKDHDEATEPAD